MEVPRDDTRAVIDVHHVSSEKEVVDEGDDTAIRRAHRITDRSLKVDAEVSARDLTVEDAPRAESTGDLRCAWAQERPRPELRRHVRLATDLARTRVLVRDARGGRGIQRPSESRVHAETRRRDAETRHDHARAHAVDDVGSALDDHVRGDAPRRVDGNSADRAPRAATRGSRDEVQWLPGHGSV